MHLTTSHLLCMYFLSNKIELSLTNVNSFNGSGDEFLIHSSKFLKN